ncbi:hypothetical protein [Clostridium fermenticellae]|uniref:hypothetical protein n=1 Tax=Clostridium fermenticellae TaxID=2068654 RepID=UPI001FAA565E|nr:hypothetical protein [Clostridium fermenticellae]
MLIKSPAKVSTIVFAVLFVFMLQIRNFNRLEHWIEKNKFKNDITHYFHRSVVCAMVDCDPHIVLDQEMLEPKKDSSGKDEGKITAGKRLIKKLYKKYHHFADIIAADALYCKSTWIKEVLSIGMNAVVRVKDERFTIEDNRC